MMRGRLLRGGGCRVDIVADYFGSTIIGCRKKSYTSVLLLRGWNGRGDCQHGFASSSTSSSITSSSSSNSSDCVSIGNEMDWLIKDEVPLEDVRNFCIIAHVDHGKSSLASRLLQLTGNTNSTNSSSSNSNSDDSDREQVGLLDTLSVEKERGITVKASAASMLYRHESAVGKHGVLLLNMVDTPGHADFSAEVLKSLACVQGAILLFDASQGVQAQSLSVYEKATSDFIQVPSIIPVLSKVDLPNAKPIDVALTVSELFPKSFPDPDQILLTSARQNKGIDQLLQIISSQIPPPPSPIFNKVNTPLDSDTHNDTPSDTHNDNNNTNNTNNNNDLMQANVIDSWFEPKRGVICLLQIQSGTLKEGDKLSLYNYNKINHNSHNLNNSTQQYSVQEMGMMLPHRIRTKILHEGHMGYAILGLRDPRQARPGSTFVHSNDISKHNSNSNSNDSNSNDSNDSLSSSSSSWFEQQQKKQSLLLQQKSVLYASVHPMEADSFDALLTAVEKLALNDSGLDVYTTSSSTAISTAAAGVEGAATTDNNSSGGGPFLGPGLRIGFQGLLHVEVFRQRLLDEFGLEAIVTPPKVPYTIHYSSSKKNSRSSNLLIPEGPQIIEDLSQWPSHTQFKFKVYEPIVQVRIMAPMTYAGNIMDLIKRKRGTDMETKPINEDTWLFEATMPWAEVVTDFHDDLKNTSAGYASFDITSDTNTTDTDNNNSTKELLQQAPLRKVDILLNGEVVHPLAFVAHKDVAQSQGRVVCQKLQQVLPRQQFVTTIQAKTEGKIIASERIRAYRKDVLTTGGSKSVGGGDVTRKKKLLEKQKRGKKRQQDTSSGRVALSQAAFNTVISRNS